MIMMRLVLIIITSSGTPSACHTHDFLACALQIELVTLNDRLSHQRAPTELRWPNGTDMAQNSRTAGGFVFILNAFLMRPINENVL